MPISGGPSGAPGGVSGNTQFNNGGSFAGMSGTTWDDTNRTLTINGATVTTSQPILNLSQTYNGGAGVTHHGPTYNAIDTSSAAASTLGRWQTGGVDRISFRKDGFGSFANGVAVGGGANGAAAFLQLGAGSYIAANNFNGDLTFGISLASPKMLFDNNSNRLTGISSFRFAWTANTNATSAVDTALGRNAAGVVEVNNGTAGTFRDLRARLLRTEPSTVATLVAAATAGAGARSFVTDATQTLTAGIGTVVVGGGANGVPVHSDGTDWRIG